MGGGSAGVYGKAVGFGFAADFEMVGAMGFEKSNVSRVFVRVLEGGRG